MAAALDLPPSAGPARDAAILARIKRGDFDVRWGVVKSAAGGQTVRFTVLADALKIDGVRVNVSASLEQQIADVLGCSLLTPKLADLLWQQRTVDLQPSPQPIDASTEAMIAHSKRIDAAIRAKGGARGIVQTVGKHWVISNALLDHSGRAENYGWHFAGSTFGGNLYEPAVTPGLRVIQGPGWAHDVSHSDYSQTCVLVRRTCWVGARPMDLRTLLAHPVLSLAASHEGPSRVFRQPGVPEMGRIYFVKPALKRYAATAAGAALGAAAGGPAGMMLGLAAGAGVDYWRRGA